MAKTSAERQAAYRAKRAGKDSGERRLNTWVNAETYSIVAQLAKRYGVTQKSVIELLVANEDGKLKELKAKGMLLPDADAGRSASILRRNKSKAVANKSGIQKSHPAEKLPHNVKSKVGSNKRDQQTVHSAKSKPAQSLGAQYELEL